MKIKHLNGAYFRAIIVKVNKKKKMETIITNIEKLAKVSPYIKLYKTFGSDVILRNIGKITGEVDKQHIDFLLNTNGASILDYCFLGMKNRKLGANVYENIRELWQADSLLTFRFWGIVGTSCGENFGYLDKLDNSGNHYIGYYSISEPEHIYFVASSFNIFINKFLKQIELALIIDKDAINIDNDWFLNPQKLIIDDIEIAQCLQSQKTTEYNLLSKKIR